MKWFWNRPAQVYLFDYGGFSVGEVVKHKITGERAVIVRFERDRTDLRINPVVSIGWYQDQEFTTTCAELEKYPMAPPAV